MTATAVPARTSPTTPPEPLTLYMYDGSNASLTSSLLLDHVGVEWRRVDLLPGLHAVAIRAMGFPGRTVPALRVGSSRKLLGTRTIASYVASELAPGRGLLPSDPHDRARVLELEAQGERLQKALRRILYVTAGDDPALVQALIDDSGFGRLPGFGRRLVTRAIIPAARKGHAARADRIDRYLDDVREVLALADAAVEEGVLGGEVPTVADFALAPNISALALAPKAAGAVRERPSWRIAERWLPEYPLRGQLDLPDAWVERLLA